MRVPKKVAMSDQNLQHLTGGIRNTFHGNIYQLKLLMLFMVRAVNGNYEFELTTENSDAEKFDDLVIKYKRPDDNFYSYCFLQAKHSQSPEQDLITEADLKNLKTNRNGEYTEPFSLLKYFQSFKKIVNGRKWGHNNGNYQFVLCTNRDITLRNNFKENICDLKEDIRLASFITEKKQHFYKLNSNSSFIRNIAQHIGISDISEFNNFCNLLTIALQQPSEEELTNIISAELSIYFQLNSIEPIYGMLEKASIDWLKNKIGTTVTAITANEFMSWVKVKIHTLQLDSQAYKRSLKEFGIEFEKSRKLEEHCKRLGFLNYRIYGPVELGALRFINTIEAIGYNKDDSYTILTVEEALASKEKIKSCLEKEDFLIAIVCDDKSKTRKLLENVTKSRNLVLISSHKIEGYHTTIYESDRLFPALTEDSKQKLLNKTVNFQGQQIKLADLLSEYSDEVITADILYDLIQKSNDPIVIGTQIGKPKFKHSKFSFGSKLLKESCLGSGDIFVIKNLSDIKLKRYYDLEAWGDGYTNIDEWYWEHYVDVSPEFKTLFEQWKQCIELPYVKIWRNLEKVIKEDLDSLSIQERLQNYLNTFNIANLKTVIQETLSKTHIIHGVHSLKSAVNELPNKFTSEQVENLMVWHRLEGQITQFIDANEQLFKKLERKLNFFRNSFEDDLEFLGTECDPGLFSDLIYNIANNKMVVTKDPERSLEELQKQYPHASVCWVSYYIINVGPFVFHDSDEEVNLLMWEKSKGDISSLRSYFKGSTVILNNFSNNRDLKIISADPGMGKTEAINYYAHQLKKAHPTTWVSVIDCKKICQEQLKQSSLSFSCLTSGGLELSLFRIRLQYMPQTIALFFDKIDLLDKGERNNAIEFIRYLRKRNVENITITTRPQLAQKLEDKFQTLSYELQDANSWSWLEYSELLNRFNEIIGIAGTADAIMKNASDAVAFIEYFQKFKGKVKDLNIKVIYKFYKTLEEQRFKEAEIGEDAIGFYRDLFGKWALNQLMLDFKKIDTSKKMKKEISGLAYQDKRSVIINKNLEYYYAAEALVRYLEERKGDVKILDFLRRKAFLKENLAIYNLMNQIIESKDSNKLRGYWKKITDSEIIIPSTVSKVIINCEDELNFICDSYLEGKGSIQRTIVGIGRRVSFNEVTEAFIEALDKENFVLNPKWDVVSFLSYLSRKHMPMFSQLNFEVIFLTSLKSAVDEPYWLSRTGVNIICLSQTLTIDMYNAVKDRDEQLEASSFNRLLKLFGNFKIDQNSLVALCSKCVNNLKIDKWSEFNANNLKIFLQDCNVTQGARAYSNLLVNMLKLSHAKIIKMERCLLFFEPESGFSCEMAVTNQEKFVALLRQ